MQADRIPFILVAAIALVLPASSFAQSAESLSEGEIAERFQNQKTRGLSIAPATGNQAAETSQEQTPATSGTTVGTDQASDPVFINISFDFDSAALRADQKPKLTKLCNVIRNIDIERFKIMGHTDSSGSADYNQRLSRLRAEEVKRYMVSDCDIEEDRLVAVGLGESEPLNPSDPRADENRRVEFQVSS